MFIVNSFYSCHTCLSSCSYPDPNRDDFWEWVDGSPLDFTRWSQETEQGTQPSYCCPNNSLSYCGTLGSNSQWFDASCVADPTDPINYYFCQKEKGLFSLWVSNLDAI